MAASRAGSGIDVHRFGGEPPLLLCGVVADPQRGVLATSDGDVAAHAVGDALLGAAALGDLGTHFPSTDSRWRGADSMDLLERIVSLLTDAGYRPTSVDVTVIAETVRIGPIREQMREALAAVLGVQREQVSVKATTTDGLGFIGSDEGIAATAIAVVEPAQP